ncbi:hypothetical protein CR513_10634, partial [Mucuna pruriens]
MEDKMSGKGSTLILGRPFLMTVSTKIDVYARILSMEFEDNLVQFNIFEAMKHPSKDHSLYNIDMIEELVEEFTQLDSDIDNMPTYVEIFNIFPCAGSVMEEVDFINMIEVLDPSDSGNHVCMYDEELKRLISARIQVIERSTLSQMTTTDAEYDSTSKGRKLTKA